MKKYYIPQTGWFTYNEFIAPRVQHVVAMAGGVGANLEAESSGLGKVVTFSCPEGKVGRVRDQINRLYGSDDDYQISIFEKNW